MSQKSKSAMSSISKQENDNSFKLENPQKLPLDKLYIKVYNKYGARDIKAIDPYWLWEYTYPKYYPVPVNLSDENISKWLHKNNSYLKALKLFYNMSYQEFWSHVIYEPSFSIVVESFLDGAVAPYMPQPENEMILSLYSEIYSLIFAIYKRLLTCHHSETEYMEPSTVGSFLYDNSVIKIETLVSLVRIYGHNDDGPLADLISTAFKFMPLLSDHLQICSNHFYDVFESISTEAYECEMANTETTTQLTLLLYDTTFCLHMFMKLYPPLKNVCLESNFLSKIIHTYEEEVPIITKLVELVILEEESFAKQYVHNARVEMLEICNMILNTCFDLLLQSQDIKWLTIYLESIQMIGNHKHFAASYNTNYSLYSQLEMLGMIFPDYMQSHEAYEKMLFVFGPTTVDDYDEPGPSNAVAYEAVDSDDDESSDEDDNSPTSKKNIILDTKIQEVLEVLPYYGDGFIEKCLRFYGMNTQKVIDILLSSDLPEELATLDVDLPRIPPETDPNPIKPVLEYRGKKPDKHRNLNELLNDKSHIAEQKERYQKYQNEEWYDSLYNDDYESDDNEYNVPLYEGGDILDNLPKRRGTGSDDEEKGESSKIDSTKNKREDRNQKSWIHAQPQRPNKKNASKQLNGVEDKEINNEQENKNKNNNSKVPKGKGDTRYQKKQQNTYQNQQKGNPNISNGVNSEEEDEDEDESQASSSSKPKDAFCQDPAVIRARREAQYQNRTWTRKSKDVVGNPKGQGQEKDVQVNREQKGRHKSAGANHNRRAGAQWKRSRGMFPS